MDLNLLTAISPIDGRYREKTQSFAQYFSEYALIRYRIRASFLCLNWQALIRKFMAS